MDTPSNFIPHEHTLIGVEECPDLLWYFFWLLSDFDGLVYYVCVEEN